MKAISIDYEECCFIYYPSSFKCGKFYGSNHVHIPALFNPLNFVNQMIMH